MEPEKQAMLFDAVKGKNFKVVMSLLLESEGVGVNEKDANGDFPLHMAVKNHDPRTMTFLVNCGADLGVRDINGDTPMRLGYRDYEENTFKALIRVSADVHDIDFCGNTVLHRAIADKNEEMVKVYFSVCKAGVEARNEDGDTPLNLAAQNGLKSTFDLLLEHAANGYAANNKGDYPAKIAEEWFWAHMKRQLIKILSDKDDD